ncbi:MAG: tlde1 domain-containing protein [Oricola sp.]
MRKLPYPAGAAAIFGVATVVAVTPLMARGLAQMPAGLVAMPASLHDSMSLSAGLPRFEPPADSRGPRVAENGRANSLRLALQVAPNGSDIGAHRPAPRLADFDASRLSMRSASAEVPAGGLPAVGHYAWIAGQSETDATPRSADVASVSVASLDRRFAPALLSPALSLLPQPVAPTPDAFAMQVPLPRPRPEAPRAPEVEVASLEPEIPQALAVPATRAKRSADAKKPETRAALAYANPDAAIGGEAPSDGVFGRLFGKRDGKRLPGPGSKVAVYEIESATVYMPNGEKLEAHSGLAHMKDNPRYVAEKNRGPTPPNLYDLRMRESRFHGVEAIRLLPSDGRKKYNRDGLLAHTYMYVGGGGKDLSQSNGCVVFKNYERFLAAYKRGEIERLIVVPNLRELPTYTAAL